MFKASSRTLTNFFDDQDIIESVSYEELEDFPQPTVKGHAGKLVLGKINNLNVIAWKFRFIDKSNIIYDKNIGVFTNQSAINRKGIHILDLLKKYDKINVEVIFSPQYGLFAKQDKKFKINAKEQYDPTHNARIVEVFGRNIKPPAWSMKNLDLILLLIDLTVFSFDLSTLFFLFIIIFYPLFLLVLLFCQQGYVQKKF